MDMNEGEGVLLGRFAICYGTLCTSILGLRLLYFSMGIVIIIIEDKKNEEINSKTRKRKYKRKETVCGVVVLRRQGRGVKVVVAQAGGDFASRIIVEKEIYEKKEKRNKKKQDGKSRQGCLFDGAR